MKILKKCFALILLLLIVFTSTNVLANNDSKSNIASKLSKSEYTEEYKEYLKLPEEERSKVKIPRMFETSGDKTVIRNPLKKARMGTSITEPKFSLRTEIPNNMIIKDQKNTNSCWAFATITALESYLALNVDNTKDYDFSERHMEYATSRKFANNEINYYALNRNVGDGGDPFLVATPYLTNGMGAINEEDMEFENNEDQINISEIKNKEVVTQLYDATVITDDDINNLKTKIKSHIKNFGAVTAGMKGDKILESEFFKNSTGAYYCDDAEHNAIDHSVAIIGWDDTYSKDNFNSKHKPSSNGAWIIKNSWGEKVDVLKTFFNFDTMQQAKEYIMQNASAQLAQLQIEDASQITDEQVKIVLQALIENTYGENYGNIYADSEYTIEDGKIYMNFADEGYMYISYEDENIYKDLFGIEKADNKVTYENIYQYNETGSTAQIQVPCNKLYVGNIFNKKASGKEYLTQVSLTTGQTNKCTVYVNPNGDSMKKENLQKVELKAGKYEEVGIGYHTLEFSKAVEIKADKFAIVIEMEAPGSDKLIMQTESADVKVLGDIVPITEDIKIENGKCFMTYEDSDDDYFAQNQWLDMSVLHNQNEQLDNGDSTIKAFTVSSVPAGMEDEPVNPVEDDVALNTDFSTAQGKTNNIKINYVAGNSKQEYATFDVEISGIQRKLENDKNEYYYYLSPNAGETNIKNWVKISETQTDGNKISFSVNTKDISNYDEISKANTLYIYIKEVSTKGTTTSEKISKSISLGKGLNGNNDEVDDRIQLNDLNKSNSESQDESTAPKMLPKTGTSTIIIIATVVGILGFIAYIRYKKISRYVK